MKFSRLHLRNSLAALSSTLIVAALLAPPASVAAQNAGAKAATTPSSVDLRPLFNKMGLPIKRQGARNTCGVFTTTAALEFALAKRQKRGVRLSEEYLNWAANKISGDGVDGARISEIVEGFNRWGICRESSMPYLRVWSQWNEPAQAALSEARETWAMGFDCQWIARGRRLGITEVAKARKVLSEGFPVCAESDHCVLLIGYNDDPRLPGGGEFLIRNYATGQHETMSYAGAARQFYSLFWVSLPDKSASSTTPPTFPAPQ